MAKHKKYNWIPTRLTEEEFNEFIFPYLTSGSRGPQKQLSFYKLFCYFTKQNYILSNDTTF